jgi:hypothetical protein
MSLELVIGISLMSFLFLYFCFQINEEHFLLKLLSIFFFLLTIILIPRAAIQDVCFNELTNQTVIDNTTFFEYDYNCYSPNPSNINVSFTRIPIWFFRLFVTYFAIYLFYFWVQKSQKFIQIFGKR